MNTEQPKQRRLAIWLLRHFGPANDSEAMTGDLLEKVREGRSTVWFWREVMIALGVRVSKGLRAHWPEICFSVAGSVLITFPLNIMRNPEIGRAWAWGIGLGWPLSSIYDFGFRALVAALRIQVPLVIFLIFRRALSWTNIFRALAVSLPLFGCLFLLGFLYASSLHHVSWNLAGWASNFFVLLISSWPTASPVVSLLSGDD